jgi:hypothetical protein
VSNKKFTIAQLQSAGLPNSLVGYSQADIIGDVMNSDVAPDWFKKNKEVEVGGKIKSEALQSAWSKFRQKFAKGKQSLTDVFNNLGSDTTDTTTDTSGMGTSNLNTPNWDDLGS